MRMEFNVNSKAANVRTLSMCKAIVALILSTFIVNSFAQTNETVTIEGTILFLVSDSIPQDVIIIKGHPHALSQNMDAYWLYFQAMRWTQSDLLWEITRCKKERVIVDGIENPFVTMMRPGLNDFFLTYGRIVLKIRAVREREYPVKEYALALHFGGAIYDIKYLSELPVSGVPMSFECLDW